MAGSRYGLNSDEIRVLRKLIKHSPEYKGYRLDDDGLLYNSSGIRDWGCRGVCLDLIYQSTPESYAGFTKEEVYILAHFCARLFRK